MKKTGISIFIISSIVLAACSSSKKTTSATTTSTKPSNGVFAPGEAELSALQVKNPAATMQILQNGYAIYTNECTQCHGTKNIYTRAEAAWKGIIDDMAPKAKLNASQKEAVYQYVMAIKATQKQN